MSGGGLRISLTSASIGALIINIKLSNKGNKMTTTQMRDPKTDYLLTPENSALVLIDYQPMLVDGVKSQSKETLINNVVAIAKTAKLFELPIVLSSVGVEAGYQEPTISELQTLLPDVKIIDRSTTNAMEHEGFRAAVEATGRRKLIMGGALDRNLSGVPSPRPFERRIRSICSFRCDGWNKCRRPRARDAADDSGRSGTNHVGSCNGRVGTTR